jgi:hypothetical protein
VVSETQGQLIVLRTHGQSVVLRAARESNGSRTNQRPPTGAIIVGLSMAYLHWQSVFLLNHTGYQRFQDKINFKNESIKNWKQNNLTAVFVCGKYMPVLPISVDACKLFANQIR